MVDSKFQSRLVVGYIDDNHWYLVSEFIYDSKVAGARIIVPKGFETDFASIPRVPVAFWVLGNTAHAAAVVHDYLYTTGIFSKEMADDVFYEAMITSGMSRWRAWPIYEGVHLFGDMAWEIHRRADRPRTLRSE